MTPPQTDPSDRAELSREDLHSALFAQLVMQQTNMAMMLLGKVSHPETGQPVRDLEAARLFIDQLDMLETKTKGNLTKEEAALLKQSLMNLRLSFVEAVEAPETAPAAKQEPVTTPTPAQGAPQEESHKKFSKKY
jgi:Domain of unknown function (DUF1844)